MHPSALKNGKLFFETYASAHSEATVVDLGSQNVNGSLKDVMPSHLRYIGVDFVEGTGVDVVIDDPYKLPFDDESVDILVSSSCLEHSEMFWLVFLEMLRVLRPAGLLYISVPSNGDFHRFPVDCWRFYPDSGQALVNWARRNGLRPQLLESFVGDQCMGTFNDFNAVFVKDEQSGSLYPGRMTDKKSDFANGIVAGRTGFLNYRNRSEDQTNLIYTLKRKRWHWYKKAVLRGRPPV
ncbi:MAG TPA: class I SAM-dependent methyltransferase [Xanthomonadaceae bacterium]|nr:class I SAM-dependent methyltransferase [Xanthomonadaceae bacterium]